MCLTTYDHLAPSFKNEWSENSTPSPCLHAMYSNKLSFACVCYLMALTPPQCISHRVQVNNMWDCGRRSTHHMMTSDAMATCDGDMKHTV